MKKKLKKFIVRKYVMATSVAHALKEEKKRDPDDVYLDDDWKKQNEETAISRKRTGFTS